MRWGAYARYRSMTERRIDGFLYGLFMDVDVLRNSGVAPADPRHAHVDHFALRIGERATLLPSSGARSYGMLIPIRSSIVYIGLPGWINIVRRQFWPQPEAAIRYPPCATTHPPEAH